MRVPVWPICCVWGRQPRLVATRDTPTAAPSAAASSSSIANASALPIPRPPPTTTLAPANAQPAPARAAPPRPPPPAPPPDDARGVGQRHAGSRRHVTADDAGTKVGIRQRRGHPN